MTLKRTIDRAITDAFDNILGPGELTEDMTMRYLVSIGDFDVEDDNQIVEVDDLPLTNIIVAKPTSDDMKKNTNVLGTDAKLIIPGTKLTRTPEADTDKVIRFTDQEWDIRKVVGVPGDGVVVVYIFRT